MPGRGSRRWASRYSQPHFHSSWRAIVIAAGNRLAGRSTFYAAGNALYNYADTAVRGDDRTGHRCHRLRPTRVLRGDRPGEVEAVGTTLKGTIGFDARARGKIASSWLSAVVPRHGASAGPNHPRESLYNKDRGTFNTGPDIGAKPHDADYRESNALQIPADWRLVNHLEGGNLPIPGPVSGVYQVLMLEAIRTKAENGWVLK